MDDSAAILSIACLVHKMCDCATTMNAINVEAAVKQFNVVQKICQNRPVFADCYLQIPTAPIRGFSAKNRLLHQETSKTAQEASSLKGMIGTMANIQDLLVLILVLTL